MRGEEEMGGGRGRKVQKAENIGIKMTMKKPRVENDHCTNPPNQNEAK
jgi:hypothetical protein